MLPQGSVTPLQKFSKISPEDEKILELKYKYERLQLDFEVTEKEAAEARAEVRHLKQKLMEQEESYKDQIEQLRQELERITKNNPKEATNELEADDLEKVAEDLSDSLEQLARIVGYVPPKETIETQAAVEVVVSDDQPSQDEEQPVLEDLQEDTDPIDDPLKQDILSLLQSI